MATSKNSNGWICLHRQSVNSQVWQNPHLWHLWTFCLLKANHKEKHVKLSRKAKPVLVKRGQFLTGRDSLRNDLFPKKQKHKPSARTIWRRLKTLEEIGNIDKRTVSSRCSIITVLNYETYQRSDSTASVEKLSSTNGKSVQQTGQKRPAATPLAADTYEQKQGSSVQQNGKSCPAETEKVSTNNNDTNKYSSNSKEFLLSKLLFNEILKRKSDYRKPDLQGWAIHIDRMIRIDKRNPVRIAEVIRWCQQDGFWQNNILCTEKLRKQFDRLEMQMDKGQPSKAAPLERDENGLTPADKFDVQLQQKERTPDYAKQTA